MGLGRRLRWRWNGESDRKPKRQMFSASSPQHERNNSALISIWLKERRKKKPTHTHTHTHRHAHRTHTYIGIIRLTHLLLRMLTVSPCPDLLHTMPPRSYSFPPSRDRVCNISPTSVPLSSARIFTTLICCFAQSVCFAHSRRQGQERQRF